MLPLWIKKDGTPVVPFRYYFTGLYFKKTQNTFTCIRRFPPGSWGLIIPNFDCELVFLLIPAHPGRVLIYPTGIERDDMEKIIQGDTEDIKENRIVLPPIETLRPVSKIIYDFMEKDDTLKSFIKISETK